MGMVGCFVAVSPAFLAFLREDPESVPDVLYPGDGEDELQNYLDVHRAWHGIHYLLTGTAEGGALPANLAVFGGEAFGPEIGHGPARFLVPEQVAQVAAALSGLSDDDLMQRFDPQDMATKQIYPKGIWLRDGRAALDYLMTHYRGLADFFREAAERGDAVIQWLS